mgnify:CR=1 FL=1
MSKKTYDKKYKALLIGDSSVGKTSIIERFTNKSFDPAQMYTIGK